MASHRPTAAARHQAAGVARRIGTDIETARAGLGFSIEKVARRASVARSTVVRVIQGDGGVHLDTLMATAAAVGLRISLKAYPAEQPSLRDSGQLHIAQFLVTHAHSSFTPMLELPVGDPFGRAVDLAFFGPTEIVIHEIERVVPDYQAPKRAAMIKREALQSLHERPVRLVLVVEDTLRNRSFLAPHASLIHADLPATSREILRSLRDGTELGRDGLLWVRPWRQLRTVEGRTSTAPPASRDRSTM